MLNGLGKGWAKELTWETLAAIGFNVGDSHLQEHQVPGSGTWGGQTSIRPYWRCYYPNTQAIIYVVDSSDTERISTSAGEFHAILEEEELKDAVILVYANKQVQPSCTRDMQDVLCSACMP